MRDKVNLSIRMNPQLHEKIKYVADYEGRSMSRQVLYLLNHCVRDFEQKHGVIPISESGEEQ